jgi:S1-C subfamily serine protease
LEGLEAIIQGMKDGKTIEPGKLGLMPQPGAGGKEVVVAQVLPGSPANKAGLEAKDVITAIDDQPVEDLRKFRSLLGRYVAGDTIKLSVKRGEKTLEVRATLIPGNDLPPPTPAPKPDM